ncbi:MAG: TolC family protein [Ketobacteraceae bacterium]|nr:TolC family protein [Ketobacteraceae bacterium]
MGNYHHLSLCCTLMLAVAGWLAPGAVTAAPADQSLEHWIRISLEHNPDINAAYHRWQSETAFSESAGALPDPSLSFDYFIDEIQTRTGPQEYRIVLAQKLPWFGKRRLQSEIAGAMADEAHYQVLETRLALTRQLTGVWAEGIYLERELAITQDNLTLLEQIERIARTRYRLARASHPDLIRVQLQRSKIENQLTSLDRQRADLIAWLAELSNQPVLADFSWPSRFPELPPLPPEDVLLESLHNQSPKLAQLRMRITARTRQAEASELQNRPDFTVKYGRMFTGEAVNPDMEGSGEDPQFVGVGINIPLWLNKNRSVINAAHESRVQAEYAFEAARQMLKRELMQSLYQFRDAETQLERFQYALLPQAENSLTTVLKSYQTGNSDFSDLLETEKLLLNLKLEQAKLRMVRWKAYAAIQQLTAIEPLQP